MWRLWILFGCLFTGSIFSGSIYAAGPENIASMDDAFWPHPINSPPAFDRASRAETLAFIKALSEFAELPREQRAAYLTLKEVDQDSIDQWLTQTQQIIVKNYALAAQKCVISEPFCGPGSTFPELQRLSTQQMGLLDGSYVQWRDNALAFHRKYLHEQLRLAALFPRISSEIATYNRTEMTGFELPDRQFLLTFDDGPTGPDNNTDLLLKALHNKQTSGVFFVLGNRLRERLTKTPASTLKTTYQGMCVASHGMEHQSHSKWPLWRASMQSSAELIKASFGDAYINWFRPPYGQRLPESAGFVYDRNMFWNIDSQDWNNKISAKQAEERVFKLMLLWRRGIILFHDIHAKAQTAVPNLLDRGNAAGIEWIDCKSLDIDAVAD